MLLNFSYKIMLKQTIKLSQLQYRIFWKVSQLIASDDGALHLRKEKKWHGKDPGKLVNRQLQLASYEATTYVLFSFPMIGLDVTSNVFFFGTKKFWWYLSTVKSTVTQTGHNSLNIFLKKNAGIRRNFCRNSQEFAGISGVWLPCPESDKKEVANWKQLANITSQLMKIYQIQKLKRLLKPG